MLAAASLAWIGPKETTDKPGGVGGDIAAPTADDRQQVPVPGDTIRPPRFEGIRVDTFRSSPEQRGDDGTDYVAFSAVPLEIEMDTPVFKAQPRMVYINRDSIQLMADTIMAIARPFHADNQRMLQMKALKLDSVNKMIQLALAKHMEAIHVDSLNKIVAKQAALNDSIAVRIDSIFQNNVFKGNPMAFVPKRSFNFDSLAVFLPQMRDWELYESSEYKALRKDFEKKVEKLRRKRERSSN